MRQLAVGGGTCAYQWIDRAAKGATRAVIGGAAMMNTISAETSASRTLEMEKITMNKNVAGNTSTNTVRLHRVLAAKPDKVYRAFTTADAMARWLPPDGFTCSVHQMDAKVGGTYRMSFTNFTTGKTHAFGGKYLELVPNERIRYTDRFEDPNLPGEMTTSISMKPVSVGTEVNIIQEGLPAAIPVEACYLGWQQSLNHLARLVEPEIKD